MIRVIILVLSLILIPSCSAEARTINSYNFIIKLKSKYRSLTGDQAVITNWVRTPEQQAVILLNLKKKGVDIYGMYKSHKLLDELKPYLNQDKLRKLISTLENQVARGEYLSKHMCGKAVDIVVSYPSVMKKIALQYNFKVLTYNYSSHLHIAFKEGC